MPFDAYESRFVNKKVEGTSPETAAFQRAVVERAMELFENAKSKDVQRLKGILDSDIGLRLIDFVPRSVFYERLYAFFDERITANDGLFTWRAAAYTFTPLLLQEMEGPVKKAMQVFGCLRRLEEGRPQSWQDYVEENRYLFDALSAIKKEFPKDDAIFALADGLEPAGQPVRANFIRRAAAHSDFVVWEPAPGEVEVAFLDRKAHVRMPVKDVLEFFSMTQDLVKLLNVSLHLGIRRVTGQPE